MTALAMELKASDAMSSPPIVVSESTSLLETAKLMIDNRIGCVPVVNESGLLTGVVTEQTFQSQLEELYPRSAIKPDSRVVEELYVSSLRRPSTDHGGVTSERKAVPVSSVMATSPATISRQAPLSDVASQLLHEHSGHLVVVENQKPIGVIARHDLLRVYADL